MRGWIAKSQLNDELIAWSLGGYLAVNCLFEAAVRWADAYKIRFPGVSVVGPLQDRAVQLRGRVQKLLEAFCRFRTESGREPSQFERWAAQVAKKGQQVESDVAWVRSDRMHLG